MGRRMKRILKIFINLFIGISVGLLLLWRIAVYLVEKSKEEEMTDYVVKSAGFHFAYDVLLGYYTFPRDDGSTEEGQLASLREQWQGLQSDMEDEKRGKHAPDVIKAQSKYYDARIWAVIKNLPENPPDNLIVLATRNVAPSSLRTKLTDRDMHKRIRFDEQFEIPQNMSILKKYAVFIYADGNTRSLRIDRPNADATYGYIYRGIPFYLPTTPVNGLQVKYLTSDGEVIPAND